jgi:hypothetical protein
MTDEFKRKPASNTLLTLLSALDLLVIVAGAAALPISMFATDSIAFNPLYPMGIPNHVLIGSVPVVGVVMVITAWLMDASGKSKAAKLFAATPLFWGMAVFLMMLPTIG